MLMGEACAWRYSEERGRGSNYAQRLGEACARRYSEERVRSSNCAHGRSLRMEVQ